MAVVEWILVAPLVVLNVAFAIEVLVGLGPMPAMPAEPPAGRSTVVIPAHDEAAVIAGSVAAIMARSPAAHVLVVADNCRDDTAALAAAAGAEAVSRTDLERRGKGYALAFARDHLAADPPRCVIILDADCRLDDGSLERLAARATASGRPVQAVNLLRPDLAAAPMVQVSNFAFLIKNLVRQRGLVRMTRRVHLTGTGMAFPWAIFGAAPLATGDIVEDLGLGLDLAASGRGPVFASDATVWSSAASASGTLQQRTRWEGGFLATSLRRALPTMLAGIAAADARAAWWGLSLMIPPLTLLMLVDGAVLAAVAAPRLAGGSWAPAIGLLASVALATLALVAAWRREGRRFLSAAAAARVPLYIAWKVPLYLGLLRRGERTWLRAGR